MEAMRLGGRSQVNRGSLSAGDAGKHWVGISAQRNGWFPSWRVMVRWWTNGRLVPLVMFSWSTNGWLMGNRDQQWLLSKNLASADVLKWNHDGWLTDNLIMFQWLFQGQLLAWIWLNRRLCGSPMTANLVNRLFKAGLWTTYILFLEMIGDVW